ncbi:MAG TPA: thioesterase family protein [Gemmatimonadaceae bacterium]
MSVASPAFEQPIRVAADHLDELHHVNNVVYLRWIQDIATAHWTAIAPPDALQSVAWVARRHEIDYLSATVLGDELVIRTWVGQAQGLTFERLTEIRRADGQPVARARTLWVPIDRGTGKPRRVSDEVRALFSTPSR